MPLCVLFVLWFASGIGMMYWGMPAISTQDKLDRMAPLDPAKIALSPEEAAAKVGENPSPTQMRLTSFDGRPAYRIGGDSGRVIFADTGEEPKYDDLALRERAVSSWVNQPVSAASVISVTEIDQWMVGNRLRNLRPLWKYSFPDGQDVYIGESGEVLLHTTRLSRLQAYLSAVPHWLYFTPLRKHQPVWIRFATYSAFVGVAMSIFGMIVGIWMYSPQRMKYRYFKAPSSVPYKGTKRLHTIIGLVFGVATITWTFSGSLAFLPFPAPDTQPATARPAQGQAQRQRGQTGQNRRNRGGNPGLASALRGQVRMKDFAALSPTDLLSRHANLGIKEISYTSYTGQPLYSATLGDGSSRLISMDGNIVNGFDKDELIGIVKKNVPNPEKLEIRMVEEYDSYYQDRNRKKNLPVILALTNDEEASRYYIDPKTATVVGNYSNRNWVSRWLYHGLHSLNFPFLYNHRPLWDIVVITFMVGGTALSLTSLILAWRLVGKKLRQVLSDVRRTVPQPKRDPVPVTSNSSSQS